MFLILFATLAMAQESCDHSPAQFNCVQFVRNYDADTVTFNIPNVHPIIGKNISVRLFGLDTPEIKGKTDCEKKAAIEARVFVFNELSKAKRIDLIDVKKDKYFRLLARIRFDNKDLTNELLTKGFGYPYFGKTKEVRNWCQTPKEK